MAYINPIKNSPQNNGIMSGAIQLSQFVKGMNNIIPEMSMGQDSLIDALNVNIQDDGRVATREGQTLAIAGDFHSITSFKGKLYGVKNGTFTKIDKNLVETPLIPQMGNAKLYYVEVNGELYCSSKTNSFKINKYESAEYWSIESPNALPNVSFTKGIGQIRSGRYIICYTYKYGIYETGYSPFYVLDLPVSVDSNNQPNDYYTININCSGSSQSTSANIYISTANGPELFLVGENTYSVVHNNENNLSADLDTEEMNKQGFPALENIGYVNGRIYGTVDNMVYFTLPLDYRQCKPDNIMIFDSNIKIFCPVSNGYYVVTETKTDFLKGLDPADQSNVLVPIFPYSAVSGTLFRNPNDNTVGWFSHQGVIVGDQAGQLENISKNKLDFSKNYTSGASLFRQENGLEQVIFSLSEKGEDTNYQVKKVQEQVDNKI